MVMRYFRSLAGILQHLVAIVLVVLLLLSLIPGYYSLFNFYFVILIVFQMVLSLLNMRFVNLFLETVFLVLAILGFIPYLGWLFRFVALPVSLIDMVSFREGVVFRRVEVFTKESVKARYDGFREKRRENRDERLGKRDKRRNGKDKVVDAEFREK